MVFKSRVMRSEKYIIIMKGIKNAYKILVRKPLGKRPLEGNLGIGRRIVLKLILN
jgi:hypothetical protein